MILELIPHCIWRRLPRSVKRVVLFLEVVWQEDFGPGRVSIRNAWEISGAMYPPRGKR